MPKAPSWTKEEADYLQEQWGVTSIKGISMRLGRSVDAVKLKAQRIGLSDARMNFDGITVCQLGKALGREYSTMKNWINRYGMPAKKKLFAQSARVLVIAYSDFWKWAEKHKELLNLAKMEPGTIGPEPEWAKVKRKADQLRSQKTWQSVDWTPAEDQRLAQILKTEITYPELARMFNRSESSIKRRIHDLNLKMRPVRLNNIIKYTPDEVQTLLQMAQEGYSYETIGSTLGKSALGVRGKLERMGFDFKRRRLREEAK
ncbi:hypothetical protein [Paenibacillus sp. Cedars]|uniref:hypothetical protein n=1 Tax=Paenibacillus sp. Cedars TaxID=1980674 RepID=UPI0011632139|nr:hypothetical protein [Paenibacillus sp. Cedars]AWP30748.1 hypothetical protein B9D94_30870 [Paenibacillus sp. Cedars]